MTKPMRLAMLGTGTFALPTFEALLATSHDVALLITQPDRGGRGRHQHVNPMKELALTHGVEVFQPENINAPESLAFLRDRPADLYVTAAYGQILSADLLDIPGWGAINLHGSLLPKYRGAAPVQYAVWNDESESGVTIFRIEPKLDAGPILGVVKTNIGAQETAGELHDRLSILGAPLAVDVIDRIAAGTVEPLSQDSDEVTRAPKLKKEQGLIDWTRPAPLVSAQIRAVQPWPKPLTYWHRTTATSVPLLVPAIEPLPTDSDSRPGTIVSVDPAGVIVACGEGTARLQRLKPAGKKEMTGSEFARGYPVAIGDQLLPTE